MAGNMLLKLGRGAVDKKYGDKSQKNEKRKNSRAKKVDSFHYWGPKVEFRDGKLSVNENKFGEHFKSAAYYENLGLPHEDARLLARLKKQARWLDGGVTVPILHLKFGVSAVFGALPIIGDFIDVGYAAGIVAEASRVSGGLDVKVRNKMILNVVMCGIIGITPELGMIADIFFRCSTKNINILEKMLLDRVKDSARAARDAEKIGFARTQGHADIGGHSKPRTRPVVPPRYENGHDGLRQRVPAQAAEFSAKKTQEPGGDKGWLGRLKARAQDVGAMDDVVPVRRPPRPHNDGRF